MPETGEDGERRTGAEVGRRDSLVSRPLAALVLAALLGAGLLSAWLVISADFDHAKPPIRSAQDPPGPR